MDESIENKALRYAAAKQREKDAKKESDDLKTELVEYVAGLEDQMVTSDVIADFPGKLVLGQRDNWSYSEQLTEEMDEMKVRQKEEVQMGTATNNPTVFVTYTQPKGV